MSPIFIRFTSPDGKTQEGFGLFVGQPPGTVNVRYPDDTEKDMVIDDLPDHWQEQLRRWNNFGRNLYP